MYIFYSLFYPNLYFKFNATRNGIFLLKIYERINHLSFHLCWIWITFVVNADINNIYEFSFMYMYALFFFIFFFLRKMYAKVLICVCVCISILINY